MEKLLKPVQFASNDLDQALQIGERVFYAHTVELASPHDPFRMELEAAAIDAMTIGRLHYGAEVVVECTEVTDSYALCIPIGGSVAVQTPHSEVASTPSTAAITGPVGTVRLQGWCGEPDPAVLMKFERTDLEAELARLLGRDSAGPVRFSPSLNLTSGPGFQWRQLVEILAGELTGQQLMWNPLMRSRLISTVMSGLLLSADHEFRDALDARAASEPPLTVRRAIAYIESHLHEPITTPMIAAAVGLSVRALERAFATHLSTSPRRYVEQARLSLARSDLLNESPESASVAMIAARWGFSHQGRFASLYRRAYGQPPHATLKGY